jgi:TonB-dependent starch-binding outer membrane protein SusC
MRKITAKLWLLFLLLTATAANAQISITGVVVDEKGEFLPGVNVMLKGTSKGTITDVDGKFGIVVDKTWDILVFSYLGYQTQELKVDRSKPMQVVMAEDTKALNEVMVIGYQDVRKKDLTGSVAKVSIDDMIKAPVPTFDQALAGRIAGVNVSSGEGTPGGTMNIVIRGNNSLTQDNSPLYVIDGFPVEDPNAGNSINPNDIESIDVLKDASATAIYGARGANGVIIITTKRGKVGAPSITYDGNFGVQRLTRKIPLMNAYEFVKLQAEIQSVENMTGPYGYFRTYNDKTYTLEDYRNVEQFDWQDQIFQDALQQSHSVSLSGGTWQNRYTASLSYYDQDGVVIKSNYNRMQGRLGIRIKKDKFDFDLRTNYSRTVQTGSSPSQSSFSGMNNLFYSVWGYRPVTQPGRDINALIDNARDEDVDPTNDYRFNPILSLNNEYNKRVIDYTQYNGFAEYEIMKGLKMKVSGAYNIERRQNEVFSNSKTRYGSPVSTNKVNATVLHSLRQTWLNENILTYQTDIRKEHFINAIAGFTMQSSNIDSYSMQTTNIPNESLGLAGMSQGTPGVLSSALSEWTMMSYLSRVNYNYKSKYYLTASFRADGSSKFAKGNRFGYFPSASAAWTFTEEDFVQPLIPVLNSGKLRLSWGQTGNNRVGDYDTYATLLILQQNQGNYSTPTAIMSGVYPYNNNENNLGAVPGGLPNKSLKWETTAQTNIGTDLSFLNDRVSVTVDWYSKITSDLLLMATLIPSSGYGSAMKNIGKVQNNGLEFTLNTVNIQRKNFKWSTNFNIAFNRNKVLELAENQETLLTNGYFDQQFVTPNYVARIGYPIGMMYGYLFEGTYKMEDFLYDGSTYKLKSGIPYYASEANTQPGFPKYTDINNDGVIDAKDQTMIGRGDPIHIGGLTNNFTFGRFDLSIFLQWSYGANIMNANRLMFESSYGRRRDLNQFAAFADRWTFDNQDSDIPRANSSSSNLLISSRIVEDGSFLRLKTVSMGYNVDPKVTRKLKISNARIYMSAQNLFTLHNYSGYDPEVSIRNSSALTPGLDFSAYPRAMSINAGVNLTF